eukprot:4317539-Prymnesium_polylepis.1
MFAYNGCKRELEPHGLSGSSLYLSAATLAGVFATLIIHPVFTVKTRLQLQLRVEGSAEHLPGTLVPGAARDNYHGTWNAVSRMVREEGMLSLYRGMGPSMLLVSHGSVQFLVYEHAKERLAARAGAGAGASGSGGGGGQGGAALSTTELLVSSTISKICATIATYPYQARPRGPCSHRNSRTDAHRARPPRPAGAAPRLPTTRPAHARLPHAAGGALLHATARARRLRRARPLQHNSRHLPAHLAHRPHTRLLSRHPAARAALDATGVHHAAAVRARAAVAHGERLGLTARAPRPPAIWFEGRAERGGAPTGVPSKGPLTEWPEYKTRVTLGLCP